MEPYVLMGMYIAYENPAENEMDAAIELKNSFERNPRYASRCMAYMESPSFFFIFYRVTEEEYSGRMTKMLQELQRGYPRSLAQRSQYVPGKSVWSRGISGKGRGCEEENLSAPFAGRECGGGFE